MTALLIAVLITMLAIFFGKWLAAKHSRKSAELLLDGRMAQIEFLSARLRDVEPREARFRQALGYYADEETWLAPGRQHSPAFKDRGRIAREALK